MSAYLEKEKRMGPILVMAGGVLMFIGAIMVAIAAFKESVIWGLACLFIPIVGLIFIITHFQEAKSGVMAYVAGIGAVIVGAALGR